MKTCNKCLMPKSEIDFPLKYDKVRPTRRQLYCKVCANKKTKQRKKRNKKTRNRKCTKRRWLRRLISYTRKLRKRSLLACENNLTLEFLLNMWEKQTGMCAVTGLVMTHDKGDVCAASIDRVNFERGYLEDNVVLTCQWVNTGRRRCSIDDFRMILARLPR